MNRIPLILLLLAWASGSAHADIYRYTDKDGVTGFTNIPRPDRHYELVLREHVERRVEPVIPRSPASAGRIDPAQRSRYADTIREAARASAVDPALVHAVISAESGYNPHALSRKGALGLMQLMPETARRYQVADRMDPVQNIGGGTRYLGDLLRMFNNDLQLVVAAYNAGEKAVVRYGNRVPPFPETVAYVPRVLEFYRRYRTEF